MAETLATTKTKVASVIQDAGGHLSTGAAGDVEAAIRESLETFSHDLPRELVADVSGDGATYDLTLPSGYLDGFSRVIRVEYPAGERQASYLDANGYRVYRTAASAKLRLDAVTPGSGETVRITYSGLHTLDGLDGATTTTVPDWYSETFVLLCAATALYRLSARFLHEQESSLGADVVDRRSRSDETRRLADKLLARYRDQVGANRGEVPALAVINWDQPLHNGAYGLTHRRGRI